MAEEWKRDTSWRQGQLLPPEAMPLLGITDAGVYAVVITHDCDLANENLSVEPEVEVLLATKGDPAKSGNLSWGKSPRLIHLNFDDGQGGRLLLEVNILSRRTVLKADLCKFEPSAWVLSRAELEAFTRWLASRYRRTALPDAFNDALHHSKLAEKLEKTLKGTKGEAITAVLFDIEERSGTEFNLSVVLLYADEDRYGQVEAVEASIRQLFESFDHEATGGGAKIVLEDCVSISEGSITLRQARQLQKWEKDHLSLRSEPQGEMLEGP